MGRSLEFIKKYRWALLSGTMMGTSYIPFPPWALAFCWVPLWWDLLMNTATPRQAFAKGWVAQFVLSLIGFHWVSFVAHEFGFLPWPVALVILLLFAALVHLYIPLAASTVVYLRNRFQLTPGPAFILLATLHVIGEIYWPSLFAWNFGYSLLWIQSPWAQWADVIGFFGLSYCMHLINASVGWVWVRKDRRLALRAGVALAILLTLTWLGGQWKQQQWENPGSSVKALIVQANIGNLEKYFSERGSGYQREIIEKYFRIAREGITQHPETELVIFPESAIPEFLDNHNRNRRYSSLFTTGVQSLGRPVITGSYSNDPPDFKPRDDYNSFFLFGPDGQILDQPYHKTHLLMFGEYVPLGGLFPILRKWNPGGDGFGRGSGPIVMKWGDWTLGPQICYESLDPSFSRTLALKGADFLVNLTNDSWFGPRSEPYQHLYMTLARAIEVRRPLLRSTNTGISTVIEASGKIHPASPIGQEWSGLFDVKLQKNAPSTFYAHYGGLLPIVLWIVVGVIVWRARRGTSRLARNLKTNSKLRN